MIRHQLMTPVGRLVGGDLYQPKTTNAEGEPMCFKTDGRNHKKGDPRVDYYIALAIPKEAGHAHWKTIPDWGVGVWSAGQSLCGNLVRRSDFAWKIDDGDSTTPNLKNIRPCDREGYKGCWVMHLGSGTTPRIVNRDGSQALTEMGAVKRGYYIQVFLNINGNGSQSNPGIFLNHLAVSMQAFGEEIIFGPSLIDLGFGKAKLPEGASEVPVPKYQFKSNTDAISQFYQAAGIKK